MTTSYDLIIIGGGSAGLGALGMADTLGWKALIIDSDEANIGGDCLNYGCVPSKALIHLAKQFRGAKKAETFGGGRSGKADMKKILAYVHAKQALIRAHESADYLRSNGVDLKIGIASFEDEKTIRVGTERFVSDRILIATGSRPRHLPIKGIEEVLLFTNENLFYEMEELPDRLLVIGGGAIGCEMAQVFQRFGSAVTIVNRGERILSKEREKFSQILQTELEKEGISIHHKSTVVEFTDAKTALVKTGDADPELLAFDAVLLAVGRVLNLEKLNLPAAGIQQDERGRMILDDYLRTTNKHVFAAGDAAGMYQFSHGAEKHIRLLTHNFKNGFDKKHDIKDLSWVTFTEPEVATFGLTEAELKKQNIDYWRQDQDFGHDDRAIVGEYQYGQATLFFSQPTFWSKKRKILGGSIIAPNAGELIQELHLAAIAEMPIDEIDQKVYAYPTASRINQQVVMGVIQNDKKKD